MPPGPRGAPFVATPAPNPEMRHADPDRRLATLRMRAFVAQLVDRSRRTQSHAKKVQNDEWREAEWGERDLELATAQPPIRILRDGLFEWPRGRLPARRRCARLHPLGPFIPCLVRSTWPP